LGTVCNKQIAGSEILKKEENYKIEQQLDEDKHVKREEEKRREKQMRRKDK